MVTWYGSLASAHVAVQHRKFSPMDCLMVLAGGHGLDAGPLLGFLVFEKTCILRGQEPEMLETPNRPPFEEWWNQAAPIETPTS